MSKRAQLTVQTWGNSLAVRIPAAIGRAARLTKGQPVVIEVVDGGVLLRPEGAPRPNLAQMLRDFDPTLHRGEAMAFTTRLGAESF
jgi:antitoxin MazE